MKIIRILPYALLGLVALWIGVLNGRSLSAFTNRVASDWEPGVPRIFTNPQKTVQEPARTGSYPLPNSIQQTEAIPSQQPPLPGSKPPGSAKPVRQENLLIVGVDQLEDPAPVLQSVWLAIYMPDRPHFILMPIYPSQSMQGDSQKLYTTLPTLFSLTAEQALGLKFVEALEEKDLWWTHYLVLDENALMILADQAERRPRADVSLADSLESIPDPAVEPLKALFAQARVAQSLCLDPASLVAGDSQQISGLYKRIRKHISTDLDLETVLSEWSRRLQIGAITCEFPSLATAMLLP